MHDQLFSVEHRERTRPWLKAAPAISKLLRCMRGKGHSPIFAIEKWREGRHRVILWLRLDASIVKTRKGLDHERRAALREHIEQVYGSLLRSDRDFLLQQNWSGVEALFEQHRRIARHCFAHRHSPLDRRGATILWQKRAMQVDAAKSWQGQHPRWNDAAVSDNNDRVRRDGLKARTKLRVVANLLGLRDFDTDRKCGLLHRRDNQLLGATDRPVRLRNNQRNFMTGGE